LLWPLWELFSCFQDQDSCAHHIPLAMLLWEVSIVPSIHSKNKCFTICVGLSLQLLSQKKYRHMKIQVLKKRKKLWRS
jgi:hypothetical protein